MNSDKGLDPAHALQGNDLSVNPNAIESRKPEDVIRTDLARSTGLDVVYKFLLTCRYPEQVSALGRQKMGVRLRGVCNKRRYLKEFLEEHPTDLLELASCVPEVVAAFYAALLKRLDRERRADPWLLCLEKLHKIFYDLNISS